MANISDAMTKPERFIPTERLEPFYVGVDRFCEAHLTSAVEHDGRAKIIADPVEGYACLSHWEVALVDTPLFQRLRGIKQLGLAYLVYPTLGYTRFEHVIGVLARLKEVLQHIQANQSDYQYSHHLKLPTEKQLATVQLAALGHDLGHCIFSHVSEHVLSHLPGTGDYPSSEVIAAEFQRVIGRPIAIAEILSACIVTSPRFIRLLQDAAVPHASTTQRARDIAFAAANLILGQPIPNDPHSLFLAQLMSSGLDVDKLDYMLREAHMSGISLGISLRWLLTKLHLEELPAEQVPEGLKIRIRHFPAGSRFAVMALSRGGQFAFEEFSIARLALHEKLYLHQKIRAAQASLTAKLTKLPDRVPEFRELHRWLFLQESMLVHPTLRLPTMPPRESGTFRLFDDNDATVGTLALDGLLLRRELLHRGYCFGWQNAIAEPVVDDRPQSVSGTDRLMKLIQDTPGKLLETTRDSLAQIARLLGENIDVKGVDIIVDPPTYLSIQQGHDTIFIEHPTRLSVRWTMPIDKIVEYYHDNRALGYVFAPRGHLHLVLLAAERAIWDLFEVTYVQEGLLNARILELANQAKRRLHELGHYAQCRTLQPVSAFLNTLEAQTLISRVARKLALYESRTKKRVTPASVTHFCSAVSRRIATRST